MEAEKTSHKHAAQPKMECTVNSKHRLSLYLTRAALMCGFPMMFTRSLEKDG